MTKKSWAVFLTLAILLTSVFLKLSVVQAATVNTFYDVTVYATEGEGLALKELPDINSYRYFLIPEPTSLHIDMVTDDGWGHTSCNGYSGWVYLKYTKISGYCEVESPTYGYISASAYMIVNTLGEGLEQRCKPTTACSTFGPLYDGTVVSVMAIQGNWAYIYYNGRYAWCYMDYMIPTSAPAPQPPAIPQTSAAPQTPATQEIPAAQQTPATTQTPAVPEIPTASQTPATQEIPAAQQTPATTQTPAAPVTDISNSASVSEVPGLLGNETYSDITDSINPPSVEEEVRDIIARYNEMEKNSGCASFFLEEVSPEMEETLGYFDLGTGTKLVRLPSVLRVTDCSTIEEALEQRREYFSEEVRGPDDSFIKVLKEYEGNLYVGWSAVDWNLFDTDTIFILSYDDNDVSATCVREWGGEDITYRLEFTYYNGHLKLMEINQW